MRVGQGYTQGRMIPTSRTPPSDRVVGTSQDSVFSRTTRRIFLSSLGVVRNASVGTLRDGLCRLMAAGTISQTRETT